MVLQRSQVIKHDANTAANEFISYAACWYAIEQLKVEGMLFSVSDNELVTALKSAALQVGVNEALRLLKRYGISFAPFK